MGGGSAIDAGKAIRLKATHALPLEDYDDLKNGGDKISANLPPMIAVATTSGTARLVPDPCGAQTIDPRAARLTAHARVTTGPDPPPAHAERVHPNVP